MNIFAKHLNKMLKPTFAISAVYKETLSTRLTVSKISRHFVKNVNWDVNWQVFDGHGLNHRFKPSFDIQISKTSKSPQGILSKTG